MAANRERKLTLRELTGLQGSSRREFLKRISLGSGGVILFDHFLVRELCAQSEGKRMVFSLIVVDFNKCTGCRTCETVCSSFNRRQMINGKELPGLGNPYFSNIRVYHYNPDVDVPVTCLMCDDAPCIEACPIAADPQTGRKALYREGTLPVLYNDLGRCIGCGSCAEACRKQRVGAIIPNPQTHKPERLCNLCNGDPQCVAHCPFGALSHIVESTKGRYYHFSPAEVSRTLARRWYDRD